MARLVHGWGINDADYVVHPRVDGKQVMCPFYMKWRSMVERCHSEKLQQRYPTYIGCKIDIRWKYFMAFRRWMEKQDWEGLHHDKDILGDGKLYSPETCCFIPGWLNKLFNDNGAKRGKYKIGVYLPKGRKQFRAEVSRGRTDKKGRAQPDYLGYYDTEEEAHQAYLEAKLEHVAKLMHNYPDQRIKEAVLTKANELYKGENLESTRLLSY